MQELDCLFCKIVNRRIPAKIIYEDEHVVAFDDIHPKAPVHQLIIPKEHIARINDLQSSHKAILGHLILVSKQLALEQGISESGYRILMNCNKDGGQEVFHIHLHLLGGRPLTWPPG